MKCDQTVVFRALTMSFLSLLTSFICYAQKDSVVDNGYYITYPNKAVVRAFISQKFAPLNIRAKNHDDLYYRSNSKLGVGLGATYKSLTLNLGYGFPFLNRDQGKGETKGLDLQLHIYPKKWAIDLLGVFLKGYYLDPDDNNGLGLADYYQRPDVRRGLTGISVFRVPNAGKFSYKASVVHSEWQTKSAGSVLYGGEAYYGVVRADSALVPGKVSNNFDQAGIKTFHFFNVGPGIGYAYTFVLDGHFFISGSAIASAHFNFVSEQKASDKQTKASVTPGAVYKAGIGYNSSTWSVSANILGNALFSGSVASPNKYYLPTGNYRFTVAKKINIRREANK